MNSFIANFIAMFVPNRQRRHIIRRKIKHFDELVTPAELKQAVENTENQKAAHAAAVADAAAKEELRQKYEAVKQEWRNRNNGISPLPGRFSEYDLVFGIGATCHIIGVLDANKLRTFTSPLDYTGGIEPEFWGIKADLWRDSRFREKIDCLCNDFKDYFNPLDIKPVNMAITTQLHHYVVNTKTGIRFIHLFDINKSLEIQMPEVLEKIERRANRMLRAIDKSDRILICWMHRIFDQRHMLDAPVSDKDIKDAVRKLQKRWPEKKFDLVFFEHDGTKNEYEFDKVEVASGAYRVRSNHFIIHDAYRYVANYFQGSHWAVSTIAEMLNNITLTGKLADIQPEGKLD